MPRRKSKEGFTMVEISLSIALIAVLALAIVFIILNTIASFRRGLVLNDINTTGMALVDDLRTSVQNSSLQPFESDCQKVNGNRTACVSDHAAKFVMVVKKSSDFTVAGKKLNDIPIYGAFCTGKYSYIWNSGYFWAENTTKPNGVNPVKITYLNKNGAKATKTDFRLLKIRDDSRAVCVSAFKSNYNTNFQNTFAGAFDITSYARVTEDPIELLDQSLAIYNLTASKPAENTKGDNWFYNVSFILGTIKGGANIKTSGKSCSAPNDVATEAFEYCAINKFNFAVQANGD